MKRVRFLGMECISIKATARLIQSLDIFDYRAMNLQFGRKLPNGKYKIVTEDEIAKEYIAEGKGVSFQGDVYFHAHKLGNNKHFQRFMNRYNRSNERSRKMEGNGQIYRNGVLSEFLKEPSHFHMVQSMISLYEMGVFSIEKLESKLNQYVKPEGVLFVLNELQESVKAG